MIPAYSPEARGRSERVFRTHQDRLVKELALSGVTQMEEANEYMAKRYIPAYNVEFMVKAPEDGSAFITWIGGDLGEILCERFERVVGSDNCVRFERLTLQIPSDSHRFHYVKAKVVVRRYENGNLAIFHGPRRLAVYDPSGCGLKKEIRAVA